MLRLGNSSRRCADPFMTDNWAAQQQGPCRSKSKWRQTSRGLIRYGKAVTYLTKDFFNFPAEHWDHLRM
jgi:hypothetical protein